jgi:hypothetical protein
MLARLADPEAPAPPPDGLKPAEIADLCRLADAHGVLTIVWRKLAGRLPPEVENDVLVRVGQSLMLKRHGEEMLARMRADGVACAIVKGPVFQRLLYGDPNDRPFTDIDLLVRKDDLPRAFEVMEQNGYRTSRKIVWDNSDRDQEYPFWHEANRAVVFELHGDIVHYPMLRRRVSLDLDALERAGRGDPEGPAALLVIAIVHAAFGHKFHRLQMIVDILQAARRLPAGAEAGFAEVAVAMKLALEARIGLQLAADTFGDRRCAQLAAMLPHGMAARLGAGLITPNACLTAQDTRNRSSWARRKAFRMLQYLP